MGDAEAGAHVDPALTEPYGEPLGPRAVPRPSPLPPAGASFDCVEG